MNPYTPTLLTAESDRASYHSPMVSFIYLCMYGGIAWIATALVGNYLGVWDSYWVPSIVFLAFTMLGSYRLIGSESGGKLLLGTFLIWFPYPIHAGVAACMVSSGMMPIREFAFNNLPIVYWWTVTLLMITLGWIATTFYLRSSRTRIDATIGTQFVVTSWAGQLIIVGIATLAVGCS
jgi:hypothetical protein